MHLILRQPNNGPGYWKRTNKQVQEEIIEATSALELSAKWRRSERLTETSAHRHMKREG